MWNGRGALGALAMRHTRRRRGAALEWALLSWVQRTCPAAPSAVVWGVLHRAVRRWRLRGSVLREVTLAHLALLQQLGRGVARRALRAWRAAVDSRRSGRAHELLLQTLTLRELAPGPTPRQKLGAALSRWQRVERQQVRNGDRSRVAAALLSPRPASRRAQGAPTHPEASCRLVSRRHVARLERPRNWEPPHFRLAFGQQAGEGNADVPPVLRQLLRAQRRLTHADAAAISDAEQRQA